MTITEIQTLVCERFGCTRCDLLSRRRNRSVVVPRHTAMWLIRHTLPCSITEIGRAFAGRDHTTVLNALERVEARLATDRAYEEIVWELLERIDPEGTPELRRLQRLTWGEAA